MEQFIKENMLGEIDREKESIFSQVEIDMWVNLVRTNYMDMESIFGKMDEFIRGFGETI